MDAGHANSRGVKGGQVDGASRWLGAKTATGRRQIEQNYGKLPLSFEPNAGQTNSEVRFLSRGPGYKLFLTGDQAVLLLHSKSAIARRQDFVTSYPGANGRNGRATVSEARKESDVLSMRLVRANSQATAEGTDELPGIANYLIGSDPQKWRTHVPTYAKVKFASVYPGVDLVYYGNQSGQLEYDFVVAPGADPSVIALSVTPGVQEERQDAKAGNRKLAGEHGLRIAPDGDLIVHLRDGDVRLGKPSVYQDLSAVHVSPGSGSIGESKSSWSLGQGTEGKRPLPIVNRKPVEAHYVLDAQDRVHFALGPYDRTQPLCIDPILYYSTYLGGAVFDVGTGIAIDSQGNAYLAGVTSSPDFPNATDALNGTAQDAFVTELNPTGTAVIYYTYLGGSGSDSAGGVAVDGSGNAYVVGFTQSGNFPTQYPLAGSTNNTPGPGYTGPNSYAAQYGTGFVAELPPGGASLVFSTYLGGHTGAGPVFTGARAAGDIVQGVAVDPTCSSSACNLYVTGITL